MNCWLVVDVAGEVVVVAVADSAAEVAAVSVAAEGCVLLHRAVRR